MKISARIEAADGPSRELDLAIFQAIGAPCPFQFMNKLIALEYNDQENAYFARVSDDMRVKYAPPHYTASIDAALLLVPTDGSMRIAELSLAWEPDRPEVWPAVVLRWYPPRTEVDGKSWHCRITSAATPALAIAAAAIKARGL